MQIVNKRPFIEQHTLSHLFSFPIEEYVEVHMYERGEWIIHEGMPPDYLFYVLEGAAKIYLTHENGKVSLLNFVSSFEFIGEMELLHDQYYSKGIQTSTKTICYAIPFTLRERILQDPIFLRQLCIYLSEKATKISAKYASSQAYPLENRLAKFILQTADESIYKEKHVIVCDYLGVSYRHLLHVLSQFCELDFLQKNGRQYIIINKPALEKLSEVI